MNLNLIGLAVAIFGTMVLAASAFFGFSAFAGGGAQPTNRLLESAIIDAAARARTNDAGAMVVVQPDPANASHSRIQVYPYRPTAGTSLATLPSETYTGKAIISAAGLGTTFAIFISASGQVQTLAWTPSAGTYPTPPACTTPLAITIGNVIPRTLPCYPAALQ
jgi:hypothetical protein